MVPRVERVVAWFDVAAPVGSTRRKILQILSVILVVEGLSVLVMFSYVGLALGLVSLFLGIVLMFLMYRGAKAVLEEGDPAGIRLIESVVRLVGGDFVLMILGAVVISLVLLYNVAVSRNPEIGDADTVAIMFGSAVLLYPLLAVRFRIEAGFALLFLGFVAAFLVVPQAFVGLTDSGDSSSVGGWYVQYMLAAPFSSVLDIIGIPASSSGNLVTIQLQDGSVHTLEISAYCAGLYSFSIFLSAFFSYVLVFEKLGRRILAAVLVLGILIAYVGNLFRMVVVGVTGYYWGIEALHWAHVNAGWVIFLGWSMLFWYLLISYSSERPAPALG